MKKHNWSGGELSADVYYNPICVYMFVFDEPVRALHCNSHLLNHFLMFPLHLQDIALAVNAVNKKQDEKRLKGNKT